MATFGTSYNVSPNPNDTTGSILPIGSMLLWSTSTAPSGFLLCNGAAVSRTLYAALFAVVGTTWGVGDGSTTFNVPNTAGRVVRGVNGTYTQASTGGVDSVTLAANQLPNHAHTYTEPNAGTGHQHTLNNVAEKNQFNNGTAGVNRLAEIASSSSATAFAVTGITINDSLTVGGVQQTQVATSIVNTFVAINHIIKAQ